MKSYEAKIGTATIGVAFIAMSLFLLCPNKTLIYRTLNADGLAHLIGVFIALSGAMTFFGSVFPNRLVRHAGQFGCFLLGWWMVLAATVLDVVPATPLIMAVLGTGLMAILIKDVFIGVEHRNSIRTGVYDIGLQRHRL